MFARASIVSKTLFIIPTDAHYYKSVEMLKEFKSCNTCPDMFRFTQEPSSPHACTTRRYAAIALTVVNKACTYGLHKMRGISEVAEEMRFSKGSLFQGVS
jgi:hypothetical protein